MAAVKASNTWNENSCMARARAVSSSRPMGEAATEVFLNLLRNSEVSGGSMICNAMGRRMLR